MRREILFNIVKENPWQTPQSFLIELFNQSFYQITLSAESKRWVDELTQLFVTHPNYHRIYYYNHISFDDPEIVSYVARTRLPHNNSVDIAAASHWYLQFRNNFGFAIGSRVLALIYGGKLMPLVQSYMVKQPEIYGYTQREALGNYFKEIKRLEQIASRNKSIELLYAPEGTRSQHGVLAEAEIGFVRIGNHLAKSAPVVYIPFGVEYEAGFVRGINANIKTPPPVTVHIGEFSLQNDTLTKIQPDLLMKKLAVTLPGWMRGPYA